MDNIEEEEDLPYDLQAPAMILPSQELIDSESSLKEIIQEDVEHMNNSLRAIYQSWGKANTITKVCRLALTQSEILLRRRKLLLKPASYREHREFQGPKRKTFEFETL